MITRAARHPRRLVASLLLIGINDPDNARSRGNLRGLFNFVMAPPTIRDVVDGLRSSLALRIGGDDR